MSAFYNAMNCFTDGNPSREWLSEALRRPLDVTDLEKAVAHATQAGHAVAVVSPAAALHAALDAAGIGEGDEVIVPAMAFVGTANAVVHQGAVPIICDVAPDTLLLDPDRAEALLTPRTRAIVTVDYAGQECDYQRLRDLCRRHHLVLIAEAPHSEAACPATSAVERADLSVLSFDPAESRDVQWGSAVATDRDEWAAAIHRFCRHGVEETGQRSGHGEWSHSMVQLGYGYRLSPIQSAGALYRLERAEASREHRRKLTEHYGQRLRDLPMLRPLRADSTRYHAHGLFVVEVEGTGRLCRRSIFEELRQRGIPANIHYRPIHMHPFYRRRFGTQTGQCPIAERAYSRILSLPLDSEMTIEAVEYVVDALHDIVADAIDHAA